MGLFKMVESQLVNREMPPNFQRRRVALTGCWYALTAIGMSLICCGTTVFAQRGVLNFDLADAVNLDAATNTTQAHLQRIPEFLKNEKWDDAVDTLRRVMENEGERLIAVRDLDQREDGFQHFITLQQYSHWQLAQWKNSAPEALRIYRSRVDPLAERWYRDGVKRRSRVLLERVADEMFTSSYGDDALFYLGEIMFEQGDLAQARHHWEAISPLLRTPAALQPIFNAGPGRPLWLGVRGIDLEAKWEIVQPYLTDSPQQLRWLAYPDADVDMAAVRARLVLVSIMEGATQRAKIELDLLTRIAPTAQGKLGGRSGKYVDLLNDLLVASQQWESAEDNRNWRTFAGNGTHSKNAPDVTDISGQSIWSRPLPNVTVGTELLSTHLKRVAESPTGLLGYHPIVVNGRLFWSELGRVKGVELQTGKAFWEGDDYEPSDAQYGTIYKHRELTGAFPSDQPYVGVPRFTMSSHGHRIFARVGSPMTAIGNEQTGLRAHQGVIVGLDLRGEAKMLRGFPLTPESIDWSYEGTPVVSGNRLLIAMRKRDGVGAQAFVACYDLSNGKLRWRRRVCGGETLSDGRWAQLTHNLLTVDQDTVYYNTNLGVVSALRVSDGMTRWATRYPRMRVRGDDPDLRNQHLFRDLTPCLFYRGLVIVAPQDCDQIFALDSATGRKVWTSGPERAADAIHLLGVAKDRLIVSGHHLYWLDVYNGNLVGQFPAPAKLAANFASPEQRGFGRGVMSTKRVYWPTRNKILVFDTQPQHSERGWQPRLLQSHDLPMRGVHGGNLLVAENVLVVIQADQMTAFEATIESEDDP